MKNILMSKSNFFIVIIAFLTIIITRLYPLIKFGGCGLGYDTGFYRRYLELPGAFFKPQSFILGTDAFSTRLILDILSWSKIDTDLALFGSYLIFSLLLGLTIYLLAAQIFKNQNAGLLALCLFALSPVQWLAYTFMLYKQFWAIWLFLLVFYLIERRSSFFILPLLLAITGHRTTALLSIPSLFLTSISLPIIKKKKLLLVLTVIGTIILIIWLNWSIIEILWSTLQSGLPSQDLFKLKTGIFISTEEYLIESSIFIILGLIGASWLILKKQFNILLFYFITTLILVLTKSYFYQRIIILLDLSLIILGGGGLWLIYNQIKSSKYARIILVVFFLLISPVLFNTIKTYHPIVDQEKLQEIIQLRALPNNSYVITFTPDYAPWLYGWAGPDKKIISPGLFWNSWNYEQWVSFWNGDLTKQKEMLTSYRVPLYIFNPNSDYYNDACFTKISNSVWKFNCY